jgi:hypothetical protein
MSAIHVYADVELGHDPFLLYRPSSHGSGFRLAGEGVSLAGEGIGRGTRRKAARVIKKYAPKAARAAIGLISEFGTPEQKIAASTALVAGRIINGAGGCSSDRMKEAKLRALMN